MSISYSSFKELSEAASRHLEKMGRSKASIRLYLWAWNRLRKYMDDNGIHQYNEQVVRRYIEATFHKSQITDFTHYEKDHLRQCLCLIEFIHNGTIPIYIDRKPKYQLNKIFQPIITEYLDYKKSMRVSDITLRSHRWHLHQFANYLISRNIESVSFLSPLELMYYASEAFPDEPAAKNQTLIVVRRFLNYLYDKGYIRRDLSQVVPKDNYRKQAKLPSVYTKDEIRTILDSIDQTTSIGKRNHAMVVLASRLGMRASDISSLEFNHLKWAENQVLFTQKKTGHPVLLPLPSDVGESIINYLKYSRPQSDSKFVFLSPRYPHNPINSDAISHIVKNVIANSGVKIGNRKSGPHAMRHSMATQMINGGTSIPIISEVLGHSSVQTSMNYLRIDVESMRLCAADVPLVNTSFYEQKGGVFYG